MGFRQRPPSDSTGTCTEKKSGPVARERAPEDKELTPPPAWSPMPAIRPIHLLTARVHLRLWAPSAPRRVAWGGAGPESSSGEQRKGKGRGLQATVPRELGRGPAPPASGRESGGCAHSFSVQSRERAEGAEKRGAPPREVRVPPPCNPRKGLFRCLCPTPTELTREAQWGNPLKTLTVVYPSSCTCSDTLSPALGDQHSPTQG